MNIQELRLGNWVHHKTLPDKNVRITAIDELGNISYHDGRCNNESFITAIEPIRLTEELMEGAGFTQTIPYSFTKDDVCVVTEYFRDSNTKPRMQTWSTGRFLVGCRYLHELQNIYYAITGEELEIEL